MERKFTQPVATIVTSQVEFLELSELLKGINYKVQSPPSRGYPWAAITDHIDETPTLAYIDWNESMRSRFQLVDHYNPELFLALAACSQGPEFWTGEWVVDSFEGINNFAKVRSIVEGRTYEVINESNERWSVHVNYLRKATAEEIVAHFTEIDKTLDRALEEAKSDKVIGKADYTNEKSFFDQISDTPDVLKFSPKEIAESIGSVLKERSDELKRNPNPKFPAGGVSEYTPQLGEKVIGTLQNGKHAIGKYVEKSQVGIHHYIETNYLGEQQVQWCAHVEKWYQEEISVSELVAFYSQHTGTNVELIKVKK